MRRPEDTDRHIARALVIARTDPTMARYYLVTLHAKAVRSAEIDRTGPFSDDFQRKRNAEFADTAAAAFAGAIAAGGLGPVVIGDMAAEEAAASVMSLDEPRYIQPPLTREHVGQWYGVYVGADDRTAQKPNRGWWVECQILLPCYEASQHCLSRRASTTAEAIVLAGRWAALGEAVAAAETILAAETVPALAEAAE